MVGWGLQSDRLYNMHSPDMIPPSGSRGADRSAKHLAESATPLLRPLKLQQRSHQSAPEYDMSCPSLTQISG
jgi:hypothetical protein